MAARSRSTSWRNADSEVRVLLVDGDDGPFVLISESDGAKGTWHKVSPTLQRVFCDALGVETMDEATFEAVSDVLDDHLAARGFMSRGEWETQQEERDGALGLL